MSGVRRATIPACKHSAAFVITRGSSISHPSSPLRSGTRLRQRCVCPDAAPSGVGVHHEQSRSADLQRCHSLARSNATPSTILSGRRYRDSKGTKFRQPREIKTDVLHRGLGFVDGRGKCHSSAATWMDALPARLEPGLQQVSYHVGRRVAWYRGEPRNRA
jgi:hypothetical protein